MTTAPVWSSEAGEKQVVQSLGNLEESPLESQKWWRRAIQLQVQEDKKAGLSSPHPIKVKQHLLNFKLKSLNGFSYLTRRHRQSSSSVHCKSSFLHGVLQQRNPDRWVQGGGDDEGPTASLIPPTLPLYTGVSPADWNRSNPFHTTLSIPAARALWVISIGFCGIITLKSNPKKPSQLLIFCTFSRLPQPPRGIFVPPPRNCTFRWILGKYNSCL